VKGCTPMVAADGYRSCQRIAEEETCDKCSDFFGCGGLCLLFGCSQ
jgi:hypothetical protein